MISRPRESIKDARNLSVILLRPDSTAVMYVGETPIARATSERVNCRATMALSICLTSTVCKSSGVTSITVAPQPCPVARNAAGQSAEPMRFIPVTEPLLLPHRAPLNLYGSPCNVTVTPPHHYRTSQPWRLPMSEIDWPTATAMGITQAVVHDLEREHRQNPEIRALVERAATEAAERMFAAVQRRLHTV